MGENVDREGGLAEVRTILLLKVVSAFSPEPAVGKRQRGSQSRGWWFFLCPLVEVSCWQIHTG